MNPPEQTAAAVDVDWYDTESGAYDEMRAPDGSVYPHWSYFMRALQGLGLEALQQRHREARRLLRENGVTYNIYGDPFGLHRPWELDPIPLLIGSEEWAAIESGLIQRAELLNLVLADIYGPRELVKKGLLPLEVVYGHEGFLRPCDKVRSVGAHQLVIYAADLARGPDGRMWVLGDRTQAPSGAGYALENRTVISRIVPSLFRDSQVHRLALFFQALRAALAAAAPRHKDDPRVVVLTPGPHNETYFEHAYLAGYLGYTLVQGDNLMVQNGQVWMKSVGGLQPVDVIVRRVDDTFCDPVELRADSQLGVPGLLEAARRGNVAIANPLGSGVLENPALSAFLPSISKHFLGQELRLPSVATWWCGQPKELRYVLENLNKLVIKSIYRHPGERAVFGAQLTKKALTAWRDRIKARPHHFVAQEQVGFSTAPALADGQLVPRRTVLRSFLVARDDGYVVMPGGLARSAPHPGDYVVSNQAGGISKDTWVLASEPEKEAITVRAPAPAVTAIVGNGALPSRAADNLFWVGRYAERAESSARLLRTVLRRTTECGEFHDPASGECLTDLLRGLTHVTATYPGFIGEGAEQRLADPRETLEALALDVNLPGSIADSLTALARAAYTVRDRWSSDSWRVIDELSEEWETLRSLPAINLTAIQDRLDELLSALAAFSGLAMESMIRDHGWRFLDSGRRLERALMLSSLLRSTLALRVEPSVENLLFEDVLAANESLITYRRRYRSYLQRDNVLDLLLFDESNPRSLAHQLTSLEQHVSELPRDRSSHQLSAEERLIIDASTRLRLADPTQLGLLGEGDGVYLALDTLLAGLAEQLKATSGAITDSFFSHVEAPHPLDRPMSDEL